jgi:hypothetical protein
MSAIIVLLTHPHDCLPLASDTHLAPAAAAEGALKLVDGDGGATLALLVTLVNASANVGGGSETNANALGDAGVQTALLRSLAQLAKHSDSGAVWWWVVGSAMAGTIM